MLAKRTVPVLAALAVLALPPAAEARSHHHHATHHRHHARIAGVEREYWPILEEWLTPQEGRELEADVCQQLGELAAVAAAEPC